MIYWRYLFTMGLLAGAAATVNLLAVPHKAHAQDEFPKQAVRIIMPLPAGAAPDIRVRHVAEFLSTIWKRPVVVENRPGGGGIVGVQAAVAAAPDGHTLLVTPASIFTILPFQKNKPPVDINRELRPIGLISAEGMVIAVSSKLGMKTLADLIARAKEQPDTIVVGTNPAGSLPHLAARLLVATTGAPLTILPYSTGGTNDAIRDILGGRVHAVIESRPGLISVLNSGNLTPLAVMTDERVSTFADLPTASETVPGLRAVGFVALAVRSGAPAATLQRLVSALRQAYDNPELKHRLEQTGSPFRGLYDTELAAFIAAEQKLWAPIVTQ